MINSYLFVLLITLLTCYHVNSQSLSTPEMTSLIWLNNQFQIGLTLNEATICGTSGVTCAIANGEKHVITLDLRSTSSGLVPVLTTLTFPNLTSLYITCQSTTILGSEITALSTLTGLPLLATLGLNCPPIVTIPSSFPLNLPSITSIYLTGWSSTSVPETLFSSPVNQYSLFMSNFPKLTSLSLPTNNNVNVKYLTLVLPSNQTNYSFIMPATSFTSIMYLSLILNNCTYDIQINANLEQFTLNGSPSAKVSNVYVRNATEFSSWNGQVSPTLDLTSTMLPNIQYLYMGPLVSSDPSNKNIKLNVTSQVSIISLSNSNATITGLPNSLSELRVSLPVNNDPIGMTLPSSINRLHFKNVRQTIQFPPFITDLQWTNPSMLTLPTTIELSQNLSNFVVQHSSSLIGTIPSYSFRRGATLDVRNLTSLSGPVPDSFCTSLINLDISLTNITQVPECFKCNWVNKPLGYQVTLSNPVIISIIPDSYCEAKMNLASFVFIRDTIQNVSLTGTALGYGINSSVGLTLSIPNISFRYIIAQTNLLNRFEDVSFGQLSQFNGQATQQFIQRITWKLYYSTQAYYYKTSNGLGVVLNGYFEVDQPTVNINLNPCTVISFSNTSITCTTSYIPPPTSTSLTFGLTGVTSGMVSSSVLSYSIPPIQFNLTSLNSSQLIGDTQISIVGQFNPMLYSIVLYSSGNSNISCAIQLNTSSSIICTPNMTLTDLKEYTVSIKELGGNPLWIPSPQNITFIFKQKYPSISSIPISTPGGSNVTIYGQFGNSLNNVSVLIDNINCSIIGSPNSTMIQCWINSTAGVKPISVTVDGWNYKKDDITLFLSSNTTTPGGPTCQCGIHGTCLSDNQCQCTDNYQGDKCQFPPLIGVGGGGGNMINNQTTPSAEFNSTKGGGTFSFNLVAIREVGVDSQVVQEMNQFHWLYSESSIDNSLKLFTYTHNTSTNNNGSSLEMESVIEQSSEPRSISFAGINSTLSPNSIKLRINITNWPFISTLNTLIVVFSSDIGDIKDCFGNSIDPTVMSPYDLQSVKYLQIVKDNIIFYGSFFDRVLSDGRIAYSRNQLLNITTNNQVMIGINLPHCQECIIDPNFSLLLPVDNDGLTTCPSSKSSSTTWKIITGVVVGAAILAGLTVVLLKFAFKKSIRLKIFKMKTMGR